MSRLSQQFELADGRKLGYDEHGSPDGSPLFYFHGSPSARVEFALFGNEEMLQRLGVHLIAVDRPGSGLSDFQRNRRLLDWPRDVVALADNLSIDRFAVLAYSLGGPYGLACACAIPERLTRVGIVSGAALFSDAALLQSVNKGTRRYLTLPREHPRLARLFLWAFGASVRLAPRLTIANASSLLPPPDRTLVSIPGFQRGFINIMREALRGGARGAFHESLLAVSNWGFQLGDVQASVLLWHGEEDQNIPVAMARHAAAALPHGAATIYAGEGHLSLFKKNIENIVRALVT